MNIRDLFYFQTIAECQHMGKAAERLYLTQPALTKAVKRLEEDIGAPLFLRTGRRIELTELGRLLLERIYRVRQIMDDTTREVRNNALGFSGHIRMGCAPTMAKFLLPEIIPSLLRQAPGVTIELNTNISGTLVSLLKEGMLDLALTHVAGPIDGYEVTPLVNDELVIVAGKNHPIFNEPYTVHDLSKYRWLLPRRSATRPWLDAVLAKHNCPPPELQMEATSVLFLPRLIAATNMLSLLSRRNIGDIDDGGFLREVALPETELRRVFCLVYNKTSYLSPAVLRLIDLLLERADSDVPSVEDVGWPVSIR